MAFINMPSPDPSWLPPLPACLCTLLLQCLQVGLTESHYTHHTSYTLQAQTTDSDTPDCPEFEFQLCHLGQYKLRQIPSSFHFRFHICKVKIMILPTTDSCSDNQMRQCKQEKFMAKCWHMRGAQSLRLILLLPLASAALPGLPHSITVGGICL